MLSDTERADKIEKLLLNMDNWSVEQLYDVAYDAADDRWTVMSDEDLIEEYNETFNQVEE